jgi:hypothetical protein
MTIGWPDIPYLQWKETCSALHFWSQIIGKYRLAHTPWENHSWHATLYVTPRGLTTGRIPDVGGDIVVTFDLRAHCLNVEAESGAQESFALEPMSVAAFFERAKRAISAVGGRPDIHGRPNEIPDALAFAEDVDQRPYDAAAAERFHSALIRVHRVFSHFRTGYLGKVSPVHLFWGSFDLAVTRFSGRTAPVHPGGFPNLPDAVTREAYSHEVSSAGFWPGGSGIDEAMFYSYAYPVPDGFKDHPIEPDAAGWNDALGEFLLPYEAVRTARNPEATLMRFLQTTYEAAAETGAWDRPALECQLGQRCVPRTVGNPALPR